MLDSNGTCPNGYGEPRPPNIRMCIHDVGHAGNHKTASGFEWNDNGPVVRRAAETIHPDDVDVIARLKRDGAIITLHRDGSVGIDHLSGVTAKLNYETNQRAVARLLLDSLPNDRHG